MYAFNLLTHILTHKMEDDSLLDDNTIVRETPPPITPGSFSKKLIHRLGINLKTESETASLNNKNSYIYVCDRALQKSTI